MTRDERNALETQQAEVLIAIERAYNGEAHPAFASDHEAWAVIREEYIEAQTELNLVSFQLDSLDNRIRSKAGTIGTDGVAKQLFKRARRGMIELAHVAAAAQKMICNHADHADAEEKA